MGFFDKLFGKREKESLDQGLQKTREGFLSKIAKAIAGKSTIDEASDGMKELDGFSFGIKASEGLQPKGLESIQNPIPELMGMGCCILYEKHLDCYVEGHQSDSPKRWLVDEIINFYIFWM